MDHFEELSDLISDGKIDAYDSFYEAKDRFPELSTKECRDLHKQIMESIADFESERSQQMYDR